MKILCLDARPNPSAAFNQIAQILNAECCALSWTQLLKSKKSPAEAADSIWEYISSGQYQAILAPQTPFSLRTLSILAAAMDVPFYTGVKTSTFNSFARSICATRLQHTLQIPHQPFCATILDDGQPQDGSIQILGEFPHYQPRIVKPELSFEEFTNTLVQLDSARIVFAGGRGLGSQAYFEKLAACARKFNAALAASRLAVDLGWAQNDMQVGQTGRSVAPDIYIAFGISGAVQHIAGIQNAKFIYAINTDKSAPIFNFANAGVIADARSIIDKWLI